MRLPIESVKPKNKIEECQCITVDHANHLYITDDYIVTHNTTMMTKIANTAKKPTFNSEYDNGIYNYPICHGKERTDHPTQKPLSLMKDIIQKHSHEGDTILDTFGGSGTVAVASKILNRNYILIEKELEYYNICLSRINI